MRRFKIEANIYCMDNTRYPSQNRENDVQQEVYVTPSNDENGKGL